jgi:hypothetical protein
MSESRRFESDPTHLDETGKIKDQLRGPGRKVVEIPTKRPAQFPEGTQRVATRLKIEVPNDNATSLLARDIEPLSPDELREFGVKNQDLLTNSQIAEINARNTKDARGRIAEQVQDEALDESLKVLDEVKGMRGERLDASDMKDVFDPQTADVLDLVDLDEAMFDKLSPSEIRGILLRSELLTNARDQKTLKELRDLSS